MLGMRQKLFFLVKYKLKCKLKSVNLSVFVATTLLVKVLFESGGLVFIRFLRKNSPKIMENFQRKAFK